MQHIFICPADVWNTTVVREDFKDIYNKLFDLIKQWGNKYKDLNMLESEERFFGAYVRQTAQYITDKEFNIHDLQNTLLKFFNAKESLHSILDKLGDYSDPQPALLLGCTEKKCKGKLYFVQMYLKAASFLLEFEDKMPFGTYISNFVNISGTTTFNTNLGLEYDHQRCKNIKPMDDLVHGYLTDLAEATGFTNGSFSLYDISSMLATIDSAAFKNPTIQQAFVYSQCKTTDDFASGLNTCLISWRGLLESNQTHPCDGENPNNCCGFWTSKLGHNIKAIMKVMRMASRRGQSGLDMEHFMKPFENKSALLKYNVNPIGIGAYRKKISRDVTTILPWCKFANPSNDEISALPIDSCQLFQPVVTDSGICHSFNPTLSLSMLKESLFTGNNHV
jgi:hypothetical protein